MAVSRDLALVKPFNSPFVTRPATPGDLQRFLTLLWPGKQALHNTTSNTGSGTKQHVAGTQNLASAFSPNQEWIGMSWTLSGEYIQYIPAFPQPRLAAWWHVTALLFTLLLGRSFCHHLLVFHSSPCYSCIPPASCIF